MQELWDNTRDHVLVILHRTNRCSSPKGNQDKVLAYSHLEVITAQGRSYLFQSVTICAPLWMAFGLWEAFLIMKSTMTVILQSVVSVETMGCLEMRLASLTEGWWLKDRKLRYWCGISFSGTQFLAKDFSLQEFEYGIFYEQ